MYNHSLVQGNNQGSKQMLKVVHEDEHSSANEQHVGYLKGGNNLSSLMSIVSNGSGVQSNQQYGAKMSSRERNAKMIVQTQNNNKLQNVYSQNKRQIGGISAARQHQQLMNRKASEEKFSNQDSRGNMIGGMGMAVGQVGQQYGGRRQIIEQRYKSHLRGQEPQHAMHPVGLIRNPSKPTLQLPEISSITGKQTMQQI
mmetsp:Transcript_17865/g.30338  ORF Transcript_17865/g.30338 Transcript_17865/m.30338 type:complete len:198 (+) Transcript_17865:1865-2458(+)